jgi:hypothetical protein
MTVLRAVINILSKILVMVTLPIWFPVLFVVMVIGSIVTWVMDEIDNAKAKRWFWEDIY